MGKPPFPSDVADKFLLRLPDGMREELKSAAKANNRTMNAEIVARLQSTFVPGGHGQAVLLLSAKGEGGPAIAEMTPAQREISERLDRLESDLKVVVAGVKAGRFGSVTLKEEPESELKPGPESEPKRKMVVRLDGSVAPFEPPGETPAPPPASKGPTRSPNAKKIKS